MYNEITSPEIDEKGRPIDISYREMSVFENITTKEGQTATYHINLTDFCISIQQGLFITAEDIETLRNLPEDAYKKAKLNLPAVTISVKCESRHKDNKIIHYRTEFLQIDIDGIESPERLEEIRNLLNADKYTVMSFVSPSGRGLKVIMRINDAEEHLALFQAAEAYYKAKYGLVIDKATKDITRLCFVSYDSDVYINHSPSIFYAEFIEKDELRSSFLTKEQTNIIKTEIDSIQARNTYKEKKLKDLINLLHKARNGERHDIRCKVGKLFGGYYAGGLFDDNDFQILLNASDTISDKGKTSKGELQTLIDGINAGKKEPIHYEKRTNNSNHAVNLETGEIDIDLNLPFCFWKEEIISKGKTALIILNADFIQFLNSKGFCWHYPDKFDNTSKMFVQITNNIVVETDFQQLRRKLSKEYLQLLPEYITENHTRKDLIEKITTGIDSLTNPKKFDIIDGKTLEFKKDEPYKSFFYFNNGFIEVTKSNIELKEYSELNGLIWNTQIKDTDIKLLNYAEFTSAEFYKFLENVCSDRYKLNADNEPTLDNERSDALFSCIGHLLHDYKDANNFKVICLREETLTGTAEGRKGKSLIIQACKQLRNLVIENGKSWTSDNSFAYQNLDIKTQIYCLDDIPKNFVFEKLYSMTTEGIHIEKKYKSPVFLAFEECPKIAITTNYTIQGDSGSTQARKFDMELKAYYDSNHTPQKEFGHLFFTDWTAEEWNKFYNLMFFTVKFYFVGNKQIPDYYSATINEKNLLNETSEEFLDFLNDNNNFQINTEYTFSSLYEQFLQYAGYEKRDYTDKRFTASLKKFCRYKNLNYKKFNRNNTRCLIIEDKINENKSELFS